ncbi:MAG: MFS transporter [Spirochaetales bacterium]|jgi:FSR family fosmidomycin resistance protein-like MFS transporter|nr:MFS transporter [Spirochaetales bacterium]
MNKKFLWMLAAGHLFTDMNQGALPAILPFLIAAGGLSYADAAGLTFAVALSSSVIQPLFGIWADRVSKSWLMPVGILMAGCGLSLTGLLHGHYWLMFMVAVLSGIGIAAFHPEAARMANQLAGKKKGGGMSVFSVGGNIGFAFGPAAATPAMLYLGLSGSLVLAVPALAMFVILMRQSARMREGALAMAEGKNFSSVSASENEWGKFIWLTVAVVGRSVIFHNLNTFLPLYWTNVLGQSRAAGGTMLTLMFVVGAVSTFIGGHLADRFGTNKIVKIGWVLLIPSLFLFSRVSSPAVAAALLLLTACSLFTVTTPMIVLGQRYLPGRLGFASGVTLGLGVSVGGIVAPFVGKYADVNGLTAAFQMLAFLPLLGAFVTLTLRKPKMEQG